MLSDEIALTIWGLTWGLVFLLLATSLGFGQEHTHEGDVGAFYARWNKPDVRDENGKRYQSCCNKQDCRTMQVERRGTHWVAIAPTGGVYPIPDKILEQNQDDPEESPDGMAHVCIPGGQVICAVLGVQM